MTSDPTKPLCVFEVDGKPCGHPESAHFLACCTSQCGQCSIDSKDCEHDYTPPAETGRCAKCGKPKDHRDHEIYVELGTYCQYTPQSSSPSHGVAEIGAGAENTAGGLQVRYPTDAPYTPPAETPPGCCPCKKFGYQEYCSCPCHSAKLTGEAGTVSATPEQANKLLHRVLARAVSSVPNSDPELMEDIGRYLLAAQSLPSPAPQDKEGN